MLDVAKSFDRGGLDFSEISLKRFGRGHDFRAPVRGDFQRRDGVLAQKSDADDPVAMSFHELKDGIFGVRALTQNDTDIALHEEVRLQLPFAELSAPHLLKAQSLVELASPIEIGDGELQVIEVQDFKGVVSAHGFSIMAPVSGLSKSPIPLHLSHVDAASVGVEQGEVAEKGFLGGGGHALQSVVKPHPRGVRVLARRFRAGRGGQGAQPRSDSGEKALVGLKAQVRDDEARVRVPLAKANPLFKKGIVGGVSRARRRPSRLPAFAKRRRWSRGNRNNESFEHALHSIARTRGDRKLSAEGGLAGEGECAGEPDRGATAGPSHDCR